MTKTVFYSWQSDTPNAVGRGFIADALEKAVRTISQDVTVADAERNEIALDMDTRGVPGSPPVADTIFEKISNCSVFVPDVTFVAMGEKGRLVSNPNVLVEYGWALRAKGHKRIVAVMNSAFGMPSQDTLPFHMRHLRFPLAYRLEESATPEEKSREKHALVGNLISAISAVLQHQEPGEDEDALPNWTVELAQTLLAILIYSAEIDERMVIPWFDMLRANMKRSANRLRELLAEGQLGIAIEADVRPLVAALDEIADNRARVGSGQDMSTLGKEANRAAETVWVKAIVPVQSRFGGKSAAQPIIQKAIRKLNDLTERAKVLLFAGSSEEFLSGVGDVGLDLLQASIIYLRAESPTLANELRELGRQLHLVETRRMHMDGGQSQQSVITHVGQLREALLDLVGSAFPSKAATGRQ